MSLLITDAGIAASIRAGELGISYKIAEISIGTEGYTPTADQIDLRNEVQRKAITRGEVAALGRLHFETVWDGAEAFEGKELGYWLDDGTLFAVDSRDGEVITYKRKDTVVIEACELNLAASTIDNISVELLEAYSATEERSGVARIARSGDVDAGTDDSRFLTIKKLLSRTASLARSGVVQLSNSFSGTSQAKAVTEKALKDGLEQAITLEHLRGVPLDLDETFARKSGTVFRYFDSENGDNVNDGMTPVTPWRDDSVFYDTDEDGNLVWSEEANNLIALSGVSTNVYLYYKTGESHVQTHYANTRGFTIPCNVGISNYYYSSETQEYQVWDYYDPTYFPHILQKVISSHIETPNDCFSRIPFSSRKYTSIGYVRLYTATTKGYLGVTGTYNRSFINAHHGAAFRFYRAFFYIGDNPIFNQHDGGSVQYSALFSFDQGNECYRGTTYAHTVSHIITSSYGASGYPLPFDIMDNGLSRNGISLYGGVMTNVRY